MELRCYSNAVHKNTAGPTCKLQLLVALRGVMNDEWDSLRLR